MVHLFNIGDYTRCVLYGSLGQQLAEKFGYSNKEIIKRIFSWKINALLLSNQQLRISEEIKAKIKEYKKTGFEDYVGVLYAQWADAYMKVGLIDSAFACYRKSFQYCRSSGYAEGCASALSNMGLIYSNYRSNNQKALDFYFMALTYPGEIVTISIFTNIGNTYSADLQFDSAFIYYQKAFDLIHPGLNESDLLNNRNNELNSKSAEFSIALVLDKADARLNQFKHTRNEQQLKQALEAYKTCLL